MKNRDSWEIRRLHSSVLRQVACRCDWTQINWLNLFLLLLSHGWKESLRTSIFRSEENVCKESLQFLSDESVSSVLGCLHMLHFNEVISVSRDSPHLSLFDLREGSFLAAPCFRCVLFPSVENGAQLKCWPDAAQQVLKSLFCFSPDSSSLPHTCLSAIGRIPNSTLYCPVLSVSLSGSPSHPAGSVASTGSQVFTGRIWNKHKTAEF